MNSPVELWLKHPDIKKIEVSSFGRVRTLKGHCYANWIDVDGYMKVKFRVNGKIVTKKVHRLVAETFIPNPNNLPQVNHKDNDRTNNNVSNLEWCSSAYNNQYRVKFGKSQGVPVLAVNLKTHEVSKFPSQAEAGRTLGVKQTNITGVVKGRLKQAGGYWFTSADGNATDTGKPGLKVNATNTNFIRRESPNKSITPSLRLNEEDYLKFKELKEKYNLSWTKFVYYVNTLLEKDMRKNGIKTDSKPVQKDNR